MILTPDPVRLQPQLRRLRQRFTLYAENSPQPLPAPGLVMTPEIRLQCELYLPFHEVRRLFYRLYHQLLGYPPICTSTPLHDRPSWADCYVALPDWLQRSPDPSRLVELLLVDKGLMTRFIFHSFLPDRFNGAGFGRYPAQLDWLGQLLSGSGSGALRLLDAACGSGEGTWELAELLRQLGWQPSQVQIDGWTLDPLEVYAATHRYLPQAPQRQQEYRRRCAALIAAGWQERLRFQAVDLLAEGLPFAQYDLILCNGLLGGPLLHCAAQLQQVIDRLVERLKPGGWLLAANRFHGGWQREVPPSLLIGLFRRAGLVVQTVGEGIAGQRSRP